MRRGRRGDELAALGNRDRRRLDGRQHAVREAAGTMVGIDRVWPVGRRVTITGRRIVVAVPDAVVPVAVAVGGERRRALLGRLARAGPDHGAVVVGRQVFVQEEMEPGRQLEADHPHHQGGAREIPATMAAEQHGSAHYTTPPRSWIDPAKPVLPPTQEAPPRSAAIAVTSSALSAATAASARAAMGPSSSSTAARQARVLRCSPPKRLS